MLTDVVHSLKMHGFKNIILIGDSGGNQPGQRAVADSLTALWKGEPVVAHIQEYYDYAGVAKYMETHGIVDGQSDNLHDDPIITLNMFITDPNTVRYDERVKAGKAVYRPMNRVVHAHIRSIMPTDSSPNEPIFLGGGARPNARFQELAADRSEIDRRLRVGADAAEALAEPVLARACLAAGLLPRPRE